MELQSSNQQQGSPLPDPGFGNNGEVLLTVHGFALSIQSTPNNQTFVGFKPERDYGLVQLDNKGDIDVGFGRQGYVLDGFSNNRDFESFPESTVLVDGKILVTGAVYRSSNRTFYPAAARYTAEGQLDESFNQTGKLILEVIDPLNPDIADSGIGPAAARINTIHTQPLLFSDGKIIFHFYRYGTNGVPGASYLIALNSDGTLDKQFNDVGFLHLLDGNTTMRVRASSVQLDGKILVTAQLNDTNSTAVIIRLDRNGKLDASFAQKGIYRVEAIGSTLATINPTVGGNILTLGTFQHDQPSQLMLLQLTRDGVNDPAFNRGHPLYHSLPNVDLIPLASMIDAKGRILVTGRCFQPRTSTNRYGMIIRLTSDGEFDPGFAHGSGLIISGKIGEYADLILDADNKIQVAGHQTQPEFDSPVIERYLTAD
ncbi:delta-60 repeat domain-containing protein [Pseudomonas brassicacearum]|uniref:Delta-60 repeat domain-containing protein n=1 Tax=Pseudomonas brassicacearum TaxID=930166 RepID=A0A423GM75_9PSED|nr:delta-60 repeat domain-containing protein [Pseudomonas brassicacearum]ROM92494.1 hypothetical protein BK658_21385 [Pseudomonas brassicacearum]